MGLLTRDKVTGVSSLDIRGVRIGMAAGVIVALAFEIIPSWYGLFNGGVIPAIAATVAVTLILNLYFKK